MNSFLNQQYKWVQNSREVLLSHCAKLPQEAFVQEIPGFGRGSIRNILVHIGSTYQFWIGQFALKQQLIFKKATDVADVEAVRLFYKEVDGLTKSFLQRFEHQLENPIVSKSFSGQKMLEISPLQLFTHVITHEFHHKGQILSMSRHLGYTPPDTDIIR